MFLTFIDDQKLLTYPILAAPVLNTFPPQRIGAGCRDLKNG